MRVNKATVSNALKVMLIEQGLFIAELACDPATADDHAHGFRAGLIELAARLGVTPNDGSLSGDAAIAAYLDQRATMDQDEIWAEGRVISAWEGWRCTPQARRLVPDGKEID